MAYFDSGKLEKVAFPEYYFFSYYPAMCFNNVLMGV
jgi:hypothetical protein